MSLRWTGEQMTDCVFVCVWDFGFRAGIGGLTAHFTSGLVNLSCQQPAFPLKKYKNSCLQQKHKKLGISVVIGPVREQSVP